MNQPLLWSTPSQCLPGLIPYRLEQHLIFILTSCDQECPEEKQTLIPSFPHYPLGLGELVQDAFSALYVKEICQISIKFFDFNN